MASHTTVRPSAATAVALIAVLAASAWPAVQAKTKLDFVIYEQLVRPNVTFSEFPSVQGTKVTANTVLTAGPSPTSQRVGSGADIEHAVRVGTARNDNDYVEVISLQIERVTVGNKVYKGHLKIIGFINDLEAAPQQVAIVGGTGDFRWARGYCNQGIINFYPGGHTSKFDIHLVLDNED